MAAFDVLRAYLSARATITDDEFGFVEQAFVPRLLRSGDVLQRAGEPARWGAFVASGCLRSYAIDSSGDEHIIQFAPEEWWLADLESLASGQPSRYFFDAIEPSEVLLIDPPSQQRLIDRVPGYAASFRVGLQRHAAAKDRRIVDTLSTSAEERYREFLQAYPSIAQRVSQRMLASYLGITPETLSRIRNPRRRRP
jgi:CRP-like cAMP-binding protein